MNAPQTCQPISEAEAQTRRDLAALYRLLAHFGMTDLIDTHVTARIPGTADHFLVIRFGLLFHEVQPGNLLKVDSAGGVVDSPPSGAEPVNIGGFNLHSAVHMARPELACVIHTHTADGIAVACLEDGLLPITQQALKFYGHIGYHAYEGITMDVAERGRLVASLGQHRALIMRNHGLLVAGRSIGEAFYNIYALERACQAQVKAISSGRALRALRSLPQEVCQSTAEQFNSPTSLAYAEQVWQSARRLID